MRFGSLVSRGHSQGVRSREVSLKKKSREVSQDLKSLRSW